jgi:FkbM family methyltransferase
MARRSGIVHKVVRFARALVGRDYNPRLEVRCRTERFGSDYGGWEVSVDGLHRGSVVYSFGIGEDASFDLGLIRRFGLTVHAFDPTPRSLRWVALQQMPPEFVMHNYGVADREGLLAFYPPDNPEHVSHSLLHRDSTRERAIQVPMRRLSAIIQELGHDGIDLLKLDVEGAEYGVIEDLERGTVRPAQILAEFHHRLPGAGVEKTKAALAALQRMGYRVFAVSSRGNEYGFVR